MMRQGGTVNAETLAEVTRSKRTIGNNAVDKNATWDKLILNDANKKMLHSACAVFANAEALHAKGISIPRGILLYGPPGTGKTQIARTMANESGLSFIGASTADMKAGYIGQSGQLVKDLFARARNQSPCILFIDEMDIIAPARGGADDAFTKEIVGQLLQELDGIKSQSGDVFVLAATNRPSALPFCVCCLPTSLSPLIWTQVAPVLPRVAMDKAAATCAIKWSAPSRMLSFVILRQVILRGCNWNWPTSTDPLNIHTTERSRCMYIYVLRNNPCKV